MSRDERQHLGSCPDYGGNQKSGDRERWLQKRNAFNSNIILYRKGKMSKVFVFSDLSPYSFNMNNMAYHKAAGETLTPIPLSCRKSTAMDLQGNSSRIWPLMCSSFILSPTNIHRGTIIHKIPEANVSSVVVSTSIPLADSASQFPYLSNEENRLTG